MNQYLASRGYVVLSVNFRSGTGYGLNFREALNYGATGASEFNDVNGDDDRNVSFAETVTLAETLRKQGVVFESLVLPDEIHGFLKYESWLRVFQASADFLDRHLKGKT